MKASWIYLKESNWFSKRKPEHARPINQWRVGINIDSEVDALHINGDLVHTNKNNIAYCERINKAEFSITDDKNIEYILIPQYMEPDDCLFNINTILHTDMNPYSLFLDDQPDNLNISVFNIDLSWNNSVSSVGFDIDIYTKCHWKVWYAGKWSTIDICSIEPGVHSIDLTPPFGDIVYFEAIGYGDYLHVRRIYVTGKAGFASGRVLWNKGIYYYPDYYQNELPWLSGIVPIMHLSELERFPRNYKFDQIEWWIYKNDHLYQMIIFINDNFKNSNIKIIGNIEDNFDITVLKPYELNTDLDKSKIYTFSLFENKGESGTIQNWFIHKHADYKVLNFIEGSWSIGVSTCTHHQPNYGLAYSFVRFPEHEYLWDSSIRNIQNRNERESLPCHSCNKHGQCRQMLPSSYIVEDTYKIPWQTFEKNICILKNSNF